MVKATTKPATYGNPFAKPDKKYGYPPLAARAYKGDIGYGEAVERATRRENSYHEGSR